MAGVYAALAGVVVLIHLAFVMFAAAGAWLSLRWWWTPWLHLPAVAWAAFVECSGGTCPLTPLENDLRAAAGLDYYSGDFIAEYLFPVLYPEGLTRNAQYLIGGALLALNAAAYGWVVYRKRARRG